MTEFEEIRVMAKVLFIPRCAAPEDRSRMFKCRTT